MNGPGKLISLLFCGINPCMADGGRSVDSGWQPGLNPVHMVKKWFCWALGLVGWESGFGVGDILFLEMKVTIAQCTIVTNEIWP